VTSIRHRLIAICMRVAKRKKRTAEALHASIRARQRAGQAGPPRSLLRRVRVARSDDLGFPVYTLASRRRDSGRRIVYVHGGSYVHPLARQQWAFAARLADHLAASVVVPDYPLAPESSWRKSFADMTKLVRCTADAAPAGCTLIGDSSGGGGGYALAVAQQLSLAGYPPIRLVLITPFLDLTMADPRHKAMERADPWHSVAWLREAGLLWAGGDDPRRAEVSPLFGGFAGLGPTLVFTGTRDVLYPQSRDLAEGAREAGVPIELVEKAGLIHDYPLLPIPEARSAYRRIIQFIRAGSSE
jgi:monoterpene epsilon-lactone hydrolase